MVVDKAPSMLLKSSIWWPLEAVVLAAHTAKAPLGVFGRRRLGKAPSYFIRRRRTKEKARVPCYAQKGA